MGKRLDYVFYRQPLSLSPSFIPQLTCSSSRVLLTECIPQSQISFSDHFALEAVLDIILPSPATPDELELSKPHTMLSVSMSEPIISNASMASTISALTACYRFSRQRAKNELIVFGLCLGLLICLMIGSAWIPRSWINPVLVLLTAVLTWTGTTMLYEGFLFGYWEQNALMNIIEEMEILLAANSSRSP